MWFSNSYIESLHQEIRLYEEKLRQGKDSQNSNPSSEQVAAPQLGNSPQTPEQGSITSWVSLFVTGWLVTKLSLTRLIRVAKLVTAAITKKASNSYLVNLSDAIAQEQNRQGQFHATPAGYPTSEAAEELLQT